MQNKRPVFPGWLTTYGNPTNYFFEMTGPAFMSELVAKHKLAPDETR
jgi:hypothetical protein